MRLAGGRRRGHGAKQKEGPKLLFFASFGTADFLASVCVIFYFCQNKVFGNNYNKLLNALKRIDVGDTKEYQNVVYASGISACSAAYTKNSLIECGVMTKGGPKEPALWRQMGRAAVEEAQTRLVHILPSKFLRLASIHKSRRELE